MVMAVVEITYGDPVVCPLIMLVTCDGDHQGYARFWCARGWYDPLAYVRTGVQEILPDIPWLEH